MNGDWVDEMSGQNQVEALKYEDPLLFEVSINHLCWFCELTEKNREASIVSTLTSVHGNRATDLIRLSSPNVQRDINFIRAHPFVRDVDALMISEKEALLRVVSRFDTLTHKILSQTKVTLLESPLSADGQDSEILLAPSHKAMDELLSLWRSEKGFNEVKLQRKRYLKTEDGRNLNLFRSSGFFDLKAAKGILSEKQLEMFQLACDWGYYDMPKKVSISELAQRIGISESTMAEHLRKAEARLLPMLGKVLRKI